MGAPSAPVKGRGATFNPANRFRREEREAVDDGWSAPAPPEGAAEGEDRAAPARGAAGREDAGAPPPPKTSVTVVRARTIIARNDSPDIPFDQSINPYQGCEHGCVYCYARPSHAYLDLSPGLDFETKLHAKPDAAALLRAELARPGYVCEPIALGTNTDPYQPIEREWRITRSIVEVLAECNHPLTITTKGAMIERDIDLLAPMAARRLARVYISIAMLDKSLARTLDPRAPAPARRLELVRALSSAGIPVGVMVAPVIPGLTDKDLESILEAAAAHGATGAGWIMLRLPREVAPLFRGWLDAHQPLRAVHVMSLVNQVRGGRDNDPNFGARMRGSGQFATLIKRRFDLAVQRLGLNAERPPLDRTRFRPPEVARASSPDDRQGRLFG